MHLEKQIKNRAHSGNLKASASNVLKCLFLSKNTAVTAVDRCIYERILGIQHILALVTVQDGV